MKELENLLNKLIELGWKPRLESLEVFIEFTSNHEVIVRHCIESDSYSIYSLHDLVSMESVLRQFVCENGLYEGNPLEWMGQGYVGQEEYRYRNKHEIQYRLMLSSIQEDIPKFLLDNIKI